MDMTLISKADLESVIRDGSQYMTMDDTGVFDRQKLLETGRM